MILSDALTLPVSLLQTQVMTSQVRSDIESLIHNYYFFVIICSRNWRKSSLNGGF